MTKDWDSFQYEAYQNGSPIILIMIPICIDDSTLGDRNRIQTFVARWSCINSPFVYQYV